MLPWARNRDYSPGDALASSDLNDISEQCIASYTLLRAKDEQRAGSFASMYTEGWSMDVGETWANASGAGDQAIYTIRSRRVGRIYEVSLWFWQDGVSAVEFAVLGMTDGVESVIAEDVAVVTQSVWSVKTLLAPVGSGHDMTESQSLRLRVRSGQAGDRVTGITYKIRRT